MLLNLLEKKMIVIDEKDIEKTENKFGITFDESRKEAIKNI